MINLRWEGSDNITSIALHISVVPEVLLFRAEIWVLSTDVENRLAGIHKDFLLQERGIWANRSSGGTWQQEGAESVLEAAGTQDVKMCVNRRQSAAAQRVSLRPIFEV